MPHTEAAVAAKADAGAPRHADLHALDAPFTVKVPYREGQRGFRLSVSSFREGASSQSPSRTKAGLPLEPGS